MTIVVSINLDVSMETDIRNKRLAYGSIILILISWLAKNFIFSGGSPNIDLSILFVILVFLFFRWKFRYQVVDTLSTIGIKPLSRSDFLKYVLLIVVISYALSFTLSGVLGLNLTNLYMQQKSLNPSGPLRIITHYSLPTATIALLLYSIYGTFSEELFFRGIILRWLMKYNFWMANIIQAVLFGFAHLALILALPAQLSASYKAFTFLLPFIMGLVLGFFYKKTKNNLLVTWVGHYIVNTISWLVFLYFGHFI